MKHRMPLYGDDHSILVTAEFWENGYLLKNGGSTICRFEIDIITRDDICLDQFLRELGGGIYQRLQKQYGITPTKEAANLLYWDEIVDRADCRYENPDAFDDPEAQYASKSPRERAIHDWLLSWKLFQVCYEEYCNGYEETRDRDVPPVFPTRMDRHPVISCGSIDSRVLRARDAKRLTHASQYWLDKENHGSMKLKDLGFVNSTRIIFDPAMWHRADSLFGDTISDYRLQSPAPVYRVGDRAVVRFDDTPIRILPPDKQDHSTMHYLIPMIMVPILVIAVITGIKVLSGNGAVPANAFSYIVGAILAMAAIGLLGWGSSRRGAAIRIKMQCRDYQKYIRRIITDIRTRQKENAAAMRESYPPVLDPIFRMDLVRMANSVNSEIFGRIPEEPAFLKARLGLSKPGTRLVESSFKITGVSADTAFSGVRYANIHHTTVTPFTVLPPAGLLRKKQATSSKEKFLFELPEDIAKEYAFLNEAPVMLDIGKSKLIGILTEDEDVSIRPFLANLMLDLCFHHSPDDLQIVLLFSDAVNEREKQNKIRYFKHLPHFRQLLPDRSAFSFGVKQASQTMDWIHEILLRRKVGGAGNRPHILLITEEIDLLRYHTLSNFLPDSSVDTKDNPYGITFLVCAHYRRELPQYCSQVVKVTHQKDWYLLPHRQIDDGASNSLYAFQPDVLPYRHSDGPTVDEKDPYYRAFKTISALSCLKFGRSERLPMTGVLELFAERGKQRGERFDFFPDKSLSEQVCRKLQEKELARYSQSVRPDGQLNCLSSLTVPMGFDHQGVAEVDLHAAEMGPNMLVLSNCSAGRTEFLTTYLYSLSKHYLPKDVQVILADTFSHGLCSNVRIGTFRECLRAAFPNEKTRDLSAEDVAFGVLDAMEKLVAGRDMLIDKRMGIRNQKQCTLELYNSYIKDLWKHATQYLELSEEAAKEWEAKNVGMHEHLPHVFLVIDNFDELLKKMPGKKADQFLKRLHRVMQDGCRYGLHVVLAVSTLEHLRQGKLLELFQTRICLKHSVAEEVEACVGITLPAERHYPYDGRAYLYSAANAHRAYFQTSYCGETPEKGFVLPVALTYAPPDGFYESLVGERVRAEYEYAYRWNGFQQGGTQGGGGGATPGPGPNPGGDDNTGKGTGSGSNTGKGTGPGPNPGGDDNTGKGTGSDSNTDKGTGSGPKSGTDPVSGEDTTPKQDPDGPGVESDPNQTDGEERTDPSGLDPDDLGVDSDPNMSPGEAEDGPGADDPPRWFSRRGKKTSKDDPSDKTSWFERFFNRD